jgi:hypothetical protein
MLAANFGELMVPTEIDEGLHPHGRHRARRSRKKILLWALPFLVLLMIAAALVPVLISGKTPAETDHARIIMKSSDEKLESLRAKGNRINQSVGIMIPNIGYMSSAQYEMTKGNILALIEEPRAILGEARQGYTEIFDLDGVDEYIEYAKLKLAVVHVDFEQLGVIENYLDYLTGALAQRDAGTPLDSQAVNDATNATVEKMKQFSSKIEELTAQAAKIRKDQAL